MGFRPYEAALRPHGARRQRINLGSMLLADAAAVRPHGARPQGISGMLLHDAAAVQPDGARPQAVGIERLAPNAAAVQPDGARPQGIEIEGRNIRMLLPEAAVRPQGARPQVGLTLDAAAVQPDGARPQNIVPSVALERLKFDPVCPPRIRHFTPLCPPHLHNHDNAEINQLLELGGSMTFCWRIVSPRKEVLALLSMYSSQDYNRKMVAPPKFPDGWVSVYRAVMDSPNVVRLLELMHPPRTIMIPPFDYDSISCRRKSLLSTLEPLKPYFDLGANLNLPPGQYRVNFNHPEIRDIFIHRKHSQPRVLRLNESIFINLKTLNSIFDTNRDRPLTRFVDLFIGGNRYVAVSKVATVPFVEPIVWLFDKPYVSLPGGAPLPPGSKTIYVYGKPRHHISYAKPPHAEAAPALPQAQGRMPSFLENEGFKYFVNPRVIYLPCEQEQILNQIASMARGRVILFRGWEIELPSQGVNVIGQRSTLKKPCWPFSQCCVKPESLCRQASLLGLLRSRHL